MSGRRKQAQEGFTLVEMVVASAILLLVFSGFLVSFVQAARLQFMANENHTAFEIARNRLEQAKVYPYGSLGAFTETTLSNVNMYGDGAGGTGRYWRTTSVQSAACNTNLMEITVTVYYEIRPGVTSPAPVQMTAVRGL